MRTLDETRDMLKDSYEEFKHEQDEYRRQLEDISKIKESALQRRKGKMKIILFYFTYIKIFLQRKCNSTFNIYATKT